MGLYLKVLGEWLEHSGWTDADSFIKVSHVTKIRHAHQVTAASLYTLINQAYKASIDSPETESMTFEEWCADQSSHSIQFNYWLKTLSLEILLLLYVRSLREGNFQLYIESLTKLMPWMFALDHTTKIEIQLFGVRFNI